MPHGPRLMVMRGERAAQRCPALVCPHSHTPDTALMTIVTTTDRTHGPAGVRAPQEARISERRGAAIDAR
eukprot:440565-Prymnesium_polylepis.1